MENISNGALIGILVAMIFISAYFSGTETAMMSLNRYRLKHLAKTGHKGAKRVEKLLSRPDRLIGLILIGNNLVNILASAIATILGMRLHGDLGVAIATGVLTLVVLVFGEVTPKTLAAHHPEKVSFTSSYLIALLMKVLAPVVIVINFITNSFIALLGIKSPPGQRDSLNSDELRTVVNEAGGLIPSRHKDMLLSILDLERVTVNDLMIPRNEIDGIDINDDWKSILRQLTHSPHGRVVLYRDSIDDSVGMLRIKDAYRLMLEKNEFTKENLLRAADEIYYIPQGTPLNVQLLKFQRNKERIGLIVDEYGDINGLITLEDILEEIVGEFTTSISLSLTDEIIPQHDGSYHIDGSTNVRDINKSLQWQLPTDGPRTLNGLILEYLEEMPELNQRFSIEMHQMEIIELEENRIKRVNIFPIGAPVKNPHETDEPTN